LRKIMPLSTRLSSTRGPPCDTGKHGFNRSICAPLSQHKSLLRHLADVASDSVERAENKRINAVWAWHRPLSRVTLCDTAALLPKGGCVSTAGGVQSPLRRGGPLSNAGGQADHKRRVLQEPGRARQPGYRAGARAVRPCATGAVVPHAPVASRSPQRSDRSGTSR
jgi:hypothetical protein